MQMPRAPLSFFGASTSLGDGIPVLAAGVVRNGMLKVLALVMASSSGRLQFRSRELLLEAGMAAAAAAAAAAE